MCKSGNTNRKCGTALSFSAFDSTFSSNIFFLSFRLVAMNKIRPHSALNVEHFIRILTYNHDSKHYYKDTQRTRTRIHFCQYLFFLLDQKRSPYLYSCNEFFTIAIA